MIACAHQSTGKIEAAVAAKIGGQKYAVWFKDSTRFTLVERHLHITMPNRFVLDYIERNFTQAIHEAMRELTGGEVTLSYAIDPQLVKDVARRQPDRQAEAAERAVEAPPRVSRARSLAERLPLKGRFDEFVEGGSNRLAYAAARSVAENPGCHYRSLFLHGGCGLGKTHLLQAICNHFKENSPELRWRYVSGEEFTSDYVHAVRSGQMAPFHERYKGLDALVIDDVHFLANKKVTQDGFLHMFNEMDAKGKQIVLASDAHPKLISHFSESLISRFLAGMVARIDAPDFEVRLNVLRQRATRLKADISQAVLQHIAENFHSNIRELEGALLKVWAMGQISAQPVTPALVDQSLRELARQVTPAVLLSDIESTVGIYFGIRPADLHTSRKSRTIALARGIAMYLARKHTDLSFPEIGRLMGKKNHSTVLLACRRIGQMIGDGTAVSWTSAGGPRCKNIRTIVEDIEAQSQARPGSLAPDCAA